MKSKRMLGVLSALITILFMIPITSCLLARADGTVDYLYYDNSHNLQTGHCSVYSVVASSGQNVTWNGGTGGAWYYVPAGTLTIPQIIVSGNVHLILADGCSLTTTKGISVPSGNSLTIYATSEGSSMGSLTAETPDANSNAGIGGVNGQNGGTVTIHGGRVTAQSNSGAGIGGGKDGNGGTVTIHGGIVTATGAITGAGIGGGYHGNGATVTINGGTVTASGGESTSYSGGAGIGGGSAGKGGTVTINGGTVTVYGGSAGGAGIGSGAGNKAGKGSGGTVTINGGTVTANGSDKGAGIGGGDGNISFSATVTIKGGEVYAYGGKYSAGIGGGCGTINSDDDKVVAGSGYGAVVYLYGGTVTATTKGRGAGIGGGYLGSGQVMEIYGGTVTASSGHAKGRGIGGGVTRDGGGSCGAGTISVGAVGQSIVLMDPATDEPYFNRSAMLQRQSLSFYVIADSSVTVPYRVYSEDGTYEDKTCEDYTTIFVKKNEWSGDNAWYVMWGTGTFTSNVTVNGNVHLILADKAHLEVTGSILLTSGSSLTIYAQSDGSQMGELSATGAEQSAGIGGGAWLGGNITIHGGKITAVGGEDGAGIGGGVYGAGGNIRIYNGIVKATGNTGGAGIGGGFYGNGGNVTIYGGDVEAVGGSAGGAGIGGGMNEDGGNIKIYGGNVTATGDYGAGIGGGSERNGDVIEISGGIVTATGQHGAAGIGGGAAVYHGGDSGNITISGGTVTATATDSADGIGAGEIGSIGNIRITGGSVIGIGGKSGISNDTVTEGDIKVKEAENEEYYSLPAGKTMGDYHYVWILGDADKLVLVLENGEFTVTPSGKDAGSGIIAVALYDNESAGKLLEVKVFDLADAQTPAGTLAADGGLVRAYWWSGFDTMIPLCAPAEWKKWTSTDSLPTESGVYCLASDVTLTDAWNVPSGVDIELDLNGHTIDRGLGQAQAAADGYVITSSGKLTISDSSEEKTGTVTGGNNTGNGGGLLASGGIITLKDITVTGNKANAGGGLYIGEEATVRMTDCHIDNNNAAGAAGIYNKGTLTVNGGTLSGNHAINNSGGFYADNGTADFTDCKIKNNRSDNYGGAFFIDFYASVNLKGCTVSGNSAKKGGGAVEMEKDGTTLVLEDSTVTGNSVDLIVDNIKKGGGIYFYKGTVILKGVLTIKDNTCEGTVNNFCTRGNSIVFLANELSGDSEIHISADVRREITGVFDSESAFVIEES